MKTSAKVSRGQPYECSSFDAARCAHCVLTVRQHLSAPLETPFVAPCPPIAPFNLAARGVGASGRHWTAVTSVKCGQRNTLAETRKRSTDREYRQHKRWPAQRKEPLAWRRLLASASGVVVCGELGDGIDAGPGVALQRS